MDLHMLSKVQNMLEIQSLENKSKVFLEKLTVKVMKYFEFNRKQIDIVPQRFK